MGASPHPRLCVIGSCNLDLVIHAPSLPAPGQTILGGPFESFPGGKGANQAVAAARMGAEVSMIAAIGRDSAADSIAQTLATERIDTSRISRIDARTGTALISVDSTGQNTIIVAPGANTALRPQHIDAARDAIAAADAVLLQLEVPIDTVARAASLAAELGTLVILNAAPMSPLPDDLLARVDVLIVNESEAAALSRTRDAHLDSLRHLPPSTVIITRGERGADCRHDQSSFSTAAFPVSPIDTVGAGDAFVGAFAVRFIEHRIADALDSMGVSDALCWACAAGAIATTRPGAIPSLPTRAEVVRMLRTLDTHP